MASVLIFIAAIILTFSIVFSIIGKDSVFRKRPLLTLSIGVFISSMLMFIPVYRDFFSNNILGMIETIIMSIHNTIRLFVVDADYEIISIFVDDLNLTTKLIYQVVSTICYIFAPLLTFSFVVSFFKNINAYLKINLSNYHEIYIFSNINEKALVLASDIKNKKENEKKRILLLFCDIENDQQKNDMLDEIKMLKAIVLEKSIENINIKYTPRRKKHDKTHCML